MQAARFPVRAALCASLSLLSLASGLTAQAGRPLDVLELSDSSGGLEGLIDPDSDFGHTVEAIGDLDGDGVEDLLVGAPDSTSMAEGSGGKVWVLFLNADGSVRSHHKIDAASGDLSVPPVPGERFGASLANLGDLDGDGAVEVAVGSPNSRRIGKKGDLRILSLTSAGTVAADVLIGEGSGGVIGPLDNSGCFGHSVARIDDLDGDGIAELAVGEPLSKGVSSTALVGAVWVLFLNADGTVKSEVRIGAQDGGFSGTLDNNDRFGGSLVSLGDLSGDGVPDLLVGACGDDDAGTDTGTVWTLNLRASGTVQSASKYTAGGGTLPTLEEFGRSFEPLPDLDGNGIAELVVGANQGYWVLALGAGGAVISEERISKVDFPEPFGSSPAGTVGLAIAYRGDSNGDGNPTLAIGTLRNPELFDLVGLVWITEISDLDPVADFVADVPADGSSPKTVVFQDLSSGQAISSWSWDFGDGNTSSVQNPTHVFTKLGTYEVRLDVTGPAGASWVAQESLVVVDSALAQATLRNGSGVNPQVFDSLTLPVLGEDWTSEVDASALGATGLVFLIGYERALAGVPTVYGEVLVDPTSDLLVIEVGALVGGVAVLDALVPNDSALLGCPVSIQGLLNASGALTNAIDLVLGL